jgi:hypothetical protein
VVSAFVGFVFYMSAASIVISTYAGTFDNDVKTKALATGSMMILQAFLMLVDAGWIALRARMNEES